MKELNVVFWFTGLVALMTGSSLANTTWDVVADFSGASNPNGAWSYGWLNDGVFQIYTNHFSQSGGNPNWCGPLTYASWPNGYPEIWENASSVSITGVLPGQLSLEPGPDGEMSIARWTAPAAYNGNAAIQGQFLPGDRGIMGVAIFEDSNWDVPLCSATDSGVFSLSLSLAAGDTIDFGVYDPYPPLAYGDTPLEATITVPEPSMLALLLAGAISLLAYAWGRRRL